MVQAIKAKQTQGNQFRIMQTECEGEEYHEYALLCVDDCLVISYPAESLLQEEITQHFMLKEESIDVPS